MTRGVCLGYLSWMYGIWELQIYQQCEKFSEKLMILRLEPTAHVLSVPFSNQNCKAANNIIAKKAG